MCRQKSMAHCPRRELGNVYYYDVDFSGVSPRSGS
jgi:hypothetical protein